MIFFIKFWRSLTPLTQNLCQFTFINIIVLNAILVLFCSTSIHETTLSQLKDLLLLHQKFADSWRPMKIAFDYTQTGHDQIPVYFEIFFNRKIKFQYPLTSLIIFYPLNVINNFTGESYLTILKTFSFVFIAATVHFLIQIFNLSWTRSINKSNYQLSQVDLFTRNALLICLVLTFYPIIKAYSLGQIQVWVNSLFAILFWCWMKKKKKTSGVIVGIMCLIKPQYIIIFLWGLLRKQWTFTLAFVTTIITGSLASVLLFGIANNINYFTVLSFISKHGETFYSNQSINGLLNRLLFNGDNLNFEVNSFSPFNTWVYWGTTLSSITLILLSLFPPKNIKQKGSITDFSIVTLTCTIASPVAWEHHYGILLPIYAYLLPCLLQKKIFGKRTIPYLCISYVLCSNYFAITKKLAYASFNLNIIQSYLLFGGLMVLICLYILRSAEINKNITTKSKILHQLLRK